MAAQGASACRPGSVLGRGSSLRALMAVGLRGVVGGRQPLRLSDHVRALKGADDSNGSCAWSAVRDGSANRSASRSGKSTSSTVPRAESRHKFRGLDLLGTMTACAGAAMPLSSSSHEHRLHLVTPRLSTWTHAKAALRLQLRQWRSSESPGSNALCCIDEANPICLVCHAEPRAPHHRSSPPTAPHQRETQTQKVAF